MRDAALTVPRTSYGSMGLRRGKMYTLAKLSDKQPQALLSTATGNGRVLQIPCLIGADLRE